MVSNSLKARQQGGIAAYLGREDVRGQIWQVVGEADAQDFVASIVAAVNANPKLAECSNSSILSAALLGRSLRLSPAPQLGQMYLVPYKDKAQFQVGWKGYYQLAIRSGEYRRLNAVAVKEGELSRYDPFTEEVEVRPIQDPDAREAAETAGYYAFYETVGGFRKSMYWSKARMRRHAERYSPSWGSPSSFWRKDFDSMALKTMYRQLIGKYGIMSADFSRAMAAEGWEDAGPGEALPERGAPEALAAPDAPALPEEAPEEAPGAEEDPPEGLFS